MTAVQRSTYLDELEYRPGRLLAGLVPEPVVHDRNMRMPAVACRKVAVDQHNDLSRSFAARVLNAGLPLKPSVSRIALLIAAQSK